MHTKTTVGYPLLLLIAVLMTCASGFAQKLGLEPDKWADVIDRPGMAEPNSLGSLTLQLLDADSVYALRFWDSLAIAGKAKGHYFRTRFYMTKADYLFKRFTGLKKFSDRKTIPLAPIKSQIIQLHTAAINAAYHTEDDMLIGWASFYSARLMRHLGETGWAVMYSQNGVALFEKEGYSVEPTVYTWLSELLYDVREYEESYKNAQKAIAAWAKVTDTEYNEPWLQEYHARAWNSLALNYFQKKNDNAAIAHFQKALQVAAAIKDTVLLGKINGNMGRVFFHQGKYDSAMLFFNTDFRFSMAKGLYDHAASAAEWMAKIYLAKGNAGAALAEARTALRLLHQWPNRSFQRDTYHSLTQIFRTSKNVDSAFYYNDLYMALNDSLEKELATNSLAISKARLNDEISQFNIQKINRQREQEVFWRNLIIMAIIGVAVIALLIVNRQLLAEKIQKQNAEQDKLLLTKEVTAATEQLNMFTANIIEKNKLIAELEMQMNEQQSSAEHHATLHSLGQLTILTEDDWNKFKQLYEKAYPGFFRKLSIQFPDMTLAEQRMAALCKLRLSTAEMAAILGISGDSVRKSKQRLRSRIGLTNDTAIEDFLAAC